MTLKLYSFHNKKYAVFRRMLADQKHYRTMMSNWRKLQSTTWPEVRRRLARRLADASASDPRAALFTWTVCVAPKPNAAAAEALRRKVQRLPSPPLLPLPPWRGFGLTVQLHPGSDSSGFCCSRARCCPFCNKTVGFQNWFLLLKRILLES